MNSKPDQFHSPFRGCTQHHPLIEEDKRLSQYTRIIQDQNQRLNNLVEKVLQIAKMESSSFELKIEDVDVHELIKQISSQYSFRLETEVAV